MDDRLKTVDDALHYTALRRLDLVAPEEVVAWAANAIGDGSDSPALLSLACEYPGAETRGIDAALAAHLSECGARVPEIVECVLLLSGEVASGIRSGEVQPAVGGRRIVRLASHADDEPRLFGMRSAVDDWENTWPESPPLLEEIRAEAVHLADLREGILRSLTSDVSRAARGSDV